MLCLDFLVISVLRIRQLVALELSSSHPIHEYFVFEYLGEAFPSKMILLVDEIFLFEVQYIHL